MPPETATLETLEQETAVPEATRAEIPADAAPPPENQEVEAPLIESGDAYFEAIEGGKEGQAEAPGPRQTGTDYLRLLSEDKRREYRAVHAKTQSELDGFKELLIDAGVPATLADHLTKTAKDRTNELYAASLGSAGYESAALIQAAEQSQVLTAIEKALPAAVFADFKATKLPELTRGETPTTAVVEAAIQAAVSHGLKGYVEKKVAAKAYDDGFIAGVAKAERVAKGASSQPLGVTGSAVGSGTSWKTKREARDLHAQNKITTAEMRRINADPRIPDGYS